MINNLLNNLIKSLFYPYNPSPSLIDSLLKYAIPSNTNTPSLDSILSKNHPNVFSLYKKLKNNKNYSNLIYAFLILKENNKNNSNIKFYALGIMKNNFCINNTNLMMINSIGLIYKQLKLDNPNSFIYKLFLEEVKNEIKEYENSILKAPNEFLGFYCEIYEKMRKIKKISEIGEMIKNREYLNDFNYNDCNYIFNEGYNVDKNNISDDLSLNDKFIKALFKFYNDCINSYIYTGHFYDPYNEFFIKNHTIDYGLIPSFINNKTVEKICYIGKYNSFLNKKIIKDMKVFNDPIETRNTYGNKVNNISGNVVNENVANGNPTVNNILKINISKNSTSTILNHLLKITNQSIFNHFILKFNIPELLNFINSTFLFGRIDFIEFLFNSMKESKNIGRKNICSFLEAGLYKIFPNGKFNDLMDIYISMDEKMNNNYNDIFSLYLKLDYPHSFLIEEEFLIKLIYIFKFLWKIKKIEYLTRKSQFNRNTLKYFILIQKMEFYIFNEIIGEKLFDFSNGNPFLKNNFAFDELKVELNSKIDKILKGLFINTKNKKIEYFLYKLEKYLVKICKNEIKDEINEDLEVQRCFEEFQNEFGNECNFKINY